MHHMKSEEISLHISQEYSLWNRGGSSNSRFSSSSSLLITFMNASSSYQPIQLTQFTLHMHWNVSKLWSAGHWLCYKTLSYRHLQSKEQSNAWRYKSLFRHIEMNHFLPPWWPALSSSSVVNRIYPPIINFSRHPLPSAICILLYSLSFIIKGHGGLGYGSSFLISFVRP